jgi:hypothetical protein
MSITIPYNVAVQWRHGGINQAQFSLGAYVPNGNNVTRPFDLLRDDWIDYQTTPSFTSAVLNPTFITANVQTSDGVITVILGQPALINTIRFLLLDTADPVPSYAYVLQTSSDLVNVVDPFFQTRFVTTLNERSGWQTHTFEEQLVSQIRLVGLTSDQVVPFDVVKLFVYNDITLNKLPKDGVLRAQTQF